MQAWTFQDRKRVALLGDSAPWCVGWYDPDGKRKSKSIGSKSAAAKFARKIEGQLAAGTYNDHSRKKWAEFRAEYDERILPTLAIGGQGVVRQALDLFAETMAPGRVASIRTSTIDAYIAKRRLAKGRRPGSKVSPATINKELRTLKAVLRVAKRWKYTPEAPEFRMIKEVERDPRYMTDEHFAAIYNKCDVATEPGGLPYPAADWWRALLVFAYLTGWRIGEVLSLRRDDLDLDEGRATTRGQSNKGRRDGTVALDAHVVDHLKKLASFSPLVFPWSGSRKDLYVQFHAIQKAAGIHLDCDRADEHDHTPACHFYGFHRLRAAFATMNALTLPGATVQALMRHRSFTTTQRYINVAKQLAAAAPALYVPQVLAKQG